MRNKFASILIIATSLGLGSAAMAQATWAPLENVTRQNDLVVQQTTGVITHTDETDMTVTLADGQTYYLPKGFNVGALADGQRVALGLQQVGGEMRVKTLQFSAS